MNDCPKYSSYLVLIPLLKLNDVVVVEIFRNFLSIRGQYERNLGRFDGLG